MLSSAAARTYFRVRRTPDGGIAIRLINDSGANSIRGTIVSASLNVDAGFRTVGANSIVPFGVVYESDIPDGQYCWVVIQGMADVLLKDGTGSTRGNWVGVSDTAGRADASSHPGSTPPDAAVHNREIGHCLQTVAAGTDVLTRCILHFN